MEKREFTELRTDRLILKRLEKSFQFAQKYFELVSGSRKNLGMWLFWLSKMFSVESCYDYIAKEYDFWDVMEHAVFAIFLKKSGEFMGTIKAI